ncbi:MAG: hypothetical protein MJE66_05630 [Proteobacteria bacterium]|nr:hypothetical protein [Pseudomonadota bacterium]
MEIASWIQVLGTLTFGAVGAAAGFRLVVMARASGAFGVHGLAAAVICIGGASLLLIPFGKALGETAFGIPVTLAGECLMRVAMVGLAVFVWRVFRPASLLGLAGALTCAALVGTSFAWELVAQSSFVRYDPSLPSAFGTQAAFAVPFAWSAFETGSHWLGSRRRAALGLGDAATTERFLLWALATTAFIGVCALAVAIPVLAGRGAPNAAALATAGRGALYLAISWCVWRGLFRAGPAPAHQPS